MPDINKLNNVNIIKNISYGSHELQTIDLYKSESEYPNPLVIWFHGGKFSHGDKENIPVTPIQFMLESGFTVAIPNYRLSQHASFPAAMYDGVRALQYAKYSAEDWNINPDKVAVCGSSSGGMIALWIAFHGELADFNSDDPVLNISTQVQAAAVHDTQTTIDPDVIPGLIGRESPFLVEFFGIKEADFKTQNARAFYTRASAITYASEKSPPVFLCYNSKMLDINSDLTMEERMHHPVFGKYLKEKLDALHVECEWNYLEMNESCANLDDLFGNMNKFLIRHLKSSSI